MNQIPILYENSEIYIVNKPAGVSVQGGAGVKHPLDEILSQRVGQKVFPVHRLDKDTAGILVVAKNHEAASKWTKLFSSRQIKKEYVAFCIGEFPKASGTIREEIFEHGHKKNAVTNYFVEQNFTCVLNSLTSAECDDCASASVQGGEAAISKARLVLETGRMHQIRIHLAKLGCPIVGDDKHGNFRLNKKLRKELGAKNLMLAAVSITLPIDGKQQTFTMKLPPHMEAFQSAIIK